MSEVENRKAMHDLGRMGYSVYKGALEEGASHREAIAVVAGYFRGIASADVQKEDDGETTDI